MRQYLFRFSKGKDLIDKDKHFSLYDEKNNRLHHEHFIPRHSEDKNQYHRREETGHIIEHKEKQHFVRHNRRSKKFMVFLPRNIFFLEAWKYFLCHAFHRNYLYLHECEVIRKAGGTKYKTFEYTPFLNEILINEPSLIKIRVLHSRKVFSSVKINWRYFRSTEQPNQRQQALIKQVIDDLKNNKDIPNKYKFLVEMIQ